ncbi:MAG TPA: response regulator [Chloroflexota bacterium]|nr:response regulator [Chloroflexota bacterium]
MAAQKIRVLVVDDFAEARASVAKLLQFEPDIEVVGGAEDGPTALRLAREQRPDIILMDINMPGMDGIRTTEAVVAEVPLAQVIMMSVQGETDYLRRAMLAGARDFLVKPFGADELANTIRRVYELDAERRARLGAVAAAPAQPPAPTRQGRIVVMFSPKGGVGRTVIGVNLAIALRTLTGARVALADCNLQFGDVGIMLNLAGPKTIQDLLHREPDELTPEVLDSVMLPHASGVRVLLAPARPEVAELFTAEHMRAILTALRRDFDYLVIDTWTTFQDLMLTIFDHADRILLLTTLDIPAVKNIRMFLDVCEALGYPPEKVVLALNRADSTGGIDIEDIEESLRHKVAARLVSAGPLVTASINSGVPFVVSQPDAQISRNVFALARQLLTPEDLARVEAGERPAVAPTRAGFGLRRLFRHRGAE